MPTQVPSLQWTFGARQARGKEREAVLASENVGPSTKRKARAVWFWLTAIELIFAMRAVHCGVTHLTVWNAGAVIAVHVRGLARWKRGKAISK